MTKMINYANCILISLLEVVIGVLLLIKPIENTALIILIIGIALSLGGVLMLVRYFTSPVEDGQGFLFKGLTSLAVGAICLVKRISITHITYILDEIYGLIILVIGLWFVQKTVDRIRLGKSWLTPLLSSIITMVCGSVILLYQFAGVLQWRFIGLSLILEAILYLYGTFVSRTSSFYKSEE